MSILLITLIVLFAFLVCHFLGDYVFVDQLMLAAKKNGKPIGPIAFHAGVHTFLVFMAMSLIITSEALGEKGHPMCLLVIPLQFFSHWLIDIAKGRISHAFPATVGNPMNPKFWWLFGIDQLAHQLVIVAQTALVIFSIR